MQSGSTLLPSPPLISRAFLFTILVSLLSHSSRVAFPLISMCVVDLQLSNPKVHAMRDLLSAQAVYCTICLPRDQIGCSVAISAASGWSVCRQMHSMVITRIVIRPYEWRHRHDGRWPWPRQVLLASRPGFARFSRCRQAPAEQATDQGPWFVGLWLLGFRVSKREVSEWFWFFGSKIPT